VDRTGDSDMGRFDDDCKLWARKTSVAFSRCHGRIVVTAGSPARMVTKASHRRNGTQRISRGSRLFTAGCVSLDLIEA